MSFDVYRVACLGIEGEQGNREEVAVRVQWVTMQDRNQGGTIEGADVCGF